MAGFLPSYPNGTVHTRATIISSSHCIVLLDMFQLTIKLRFPYLLKLEGWLSYIHLYCSVLHQYSLSKCLN